MLLVEGMAQAGGLLLLHDMPDREKKLLYFAGIEEAKFRRPVVPGDQVRYEVEVLRLRSTFCKVAGKALVDGELAAEAVLSSAMVDREPRMSACSRDPSAGRRSIPAPCWATASTVGPFAVIGPEVEIGDGTEVGAGAQVHGPARIGRENRIYPQACIGFDPQDLKFQGEEVCAGDRRPQPVPRVLHRSTAARPRGAASPASAATTCSWPTPTSPTTARWGAARSSPTTRRSPATSRCTTTPRSAPSPPCTSSAGSAATPTSAATPSSIMDALPFVKTVGQKPACYGLNSIGLKRKGFDAGERSAAWSAPCASWCARGCNTPQALEQIREELAGDPEVDYLIAFVESAKRGIHKSPPRGGRGGGGRRALSSPDA